MLIRDYTDLLDPDYPESVLIASDWLEEQCRYQESLALRLGKLLPENLFRLGDYGYGFGSGSGYSYSSGYTHGFGYSHGSGFDFGSGHDYGYGYGHGYSSGHGQGRGTNPALVPSKYLALGSHANP